LGAAFGGGGGPEEGFKARADPETVGTIFFFGHEGLEREGGREGGRGVGGEWRKASRQEQIQKR